MVALYDSNPVQIDHSPHSKNVRQVHNRDSFSFLNRHPTKKKKCLEKCMRFSKQRRRGEQFFQTVAMRIFFSFVEMKWAKIFHAPSTSPGQIWGLVWLLQPSNKKKNSIELTNSSISYIRLRIYLYTLTRSTENWCKNYSSTSEKNSSF